MKTLKLSAPWHTHRRMVNALFEEDPDITVGEIYEPDDESGANYAFDVTISDHEKYIALDRLLCKQKQYGNIVLQIRVMEAEGNEMNLVEEYARLFRGNPKLMDIKEVVDPAGVHHAYVRFWPTVIQFFNDNIADFHGNWSGLSEEIAREVFAGGYGGIHFCTASYRENEEADEKSKGSVFGE